MAWTKFGPGTVIYTVDAAPVDFSIEVKGGGIKHAYNDVGEAITYLDGTTDPAGAQRVDSVSLICDFDFGAAGYYAFLEAHDLEDVQIEFTPSSASGASWAGTVRLRLPESASAESFGAKIGGTVVHQFVGKALFTPGAAA
jgi:hypothetical protein